MYDLSASGGYVSRPLSDIHSTIGSSILKYVAGCALLRVALIQLRYIKRYGLYALFIEALKLHATVQGAMKIYEF